MTPRIPLALGPRLENVGDDSNGSIAINSPGEWWACIEEIRRWHILVAGENDPICSVPRLWRVG